MKNYFIIHGSFASPFSNWIPYLRKEIEKRNLEVYTPDLPSGIDCQNYSNWENIMLGYVKSGLITKDTTIFAHSIAPIFICKFLVENKIKVKKLVFICGFNNYLGINEEYDNVNKTMFFDNLIDIKKYCKDIICYYSNNDPYVSFEIEENFANLIATKTHIIVNGGHLNSESGFNEFKDLIENI